MSKKDFTQIDYTNDAAKHLRDEGRLQGIQIGASHAHLLVAAYLGYSDRVALLAPQSLHCVDNQWLHREAPDLDRIQSAVGRLKSDRDLASHIPFISNTIRDGLAPQCCETGIRSADNIPVGDVEPGDDIDRVHPSVLASADSEFGHCRCCGDGILYRIDALDEQGLCEEHKGEFDLDPDERKDWDDYVEYLTKD